MGVGSEQAEPAPVCTGPQTLSPNIGFFTEFSCYSSDVKKFQLSERFIKQESLMTHHFIRLVTQEMGVPVCGGNIKKVCYRDYLEAESNTVH